MVTLIEPPVDATRFAEVNVAPEPVPPATPLAAYILTTTCVFEVVLAKIPVLAIVKVNVPPVVFVETDAVALIIELETTI